MRPCCYIARIDIHLYVLMGIFCRFLLVIPLSGVTTALSVAGAALSVVIVIVIVILIDFLWEPYAESKR